MAKNTIKAGVFSSLLMALIYVLVCGCRCAEPRGVFLWRQMEEKNICDRFQNTISESRVRYISADFAVACLKTAIGLVTSCGRRLKRYFPTDLLIVCGQ